MQGVNRVMDTNFINATDFINATTKGNYAYWLQHSDIAHIARTVHHYSNKNKDVYFSIIVSFIHLVQELSKYKNKQKGGKNSRLTFTAIIHLNKNHWVTLVVKPKSLFTIFF